VWKEINKGRKLRANILNLIIDKLGENVLLASGA
jgi:hypothetical protein